ncbi:MAG: GTPase Era [candidate division WOR-3 bacterium]|nr:MAG: GTPase Era [candidate division WOR-3 bacterium]
MAYLHYVTFQERKSVKAGYVAIIGKPNVGKSTLLNHLLGTKISAVTSKPQTTRKRILGILTEGEYQACFIDTPGIIDAEYELQEQMVGQIKSAIADADVLVLLIDPWFKNDRSFWQFTDLADEIPKIIAINKIDLVSRNDLLPLIDSLKSRRIPDIVPISALNGEGVADLKRIIFANLPEAEFFYPEEDISDSPERFFVADLIREKIFQRFKKEIPYATCVLIDDFKEREKGKDYIRAIIYVERDSQKAILIGKKGTALKKVGEEARREIESFLGRTVYLELWVKVKEKWRKNKKFLKELGY